MREGRECKFQNKVHRTFEPRINSTLVFILQLQCNLIWRLTRKENRDSDIQARKGCFTKRTMLERDKKLDVAYIRVPRIRPLSCLKDSIYDVCNFFGIFGILVKLAFGRSPSMLYVMSTFDWIPQTTTVLAKQSQSLGWEICIVKFPDPATAFCKT